MRDGDFLVRGKEISRVEGLSDAVFGFAITLLVVSLEVPRTAAEVLHAMRGFFSFAITFTILFHVWRLQFGFFRRYALEDNRTVGLTGVLLFVILFFIYPLKFVFGTFVDRLMMHAGWIDPSASQPITGHDFTLMYLAFSLGWTAVVGVFCLMYRHAYSMRERLQLTPIEVLDTKHMIRRTVLSVLPGLLVAAMNVATLLFPNADDAIAYPFVGLLLVFGVVAARTRRGMKAERLAALAAELHAVEA